MKTFVEIVGWYGAVALLLAYILVSFSVLPAEGVAYQLLCVTGSAGIATVAFYRKTYQPAVLNIIFLLVGLVAIAKALL